MLGVFIQMAHLRYVSETLQQGWYQSKNLKNINVLLRVCHQWGRLVVQAHSSPGVQHSLAGGEHQVVPRGGKQPLPLASAAASFFTSLSAVGCQPPREGRQSLAADNPLLQQ